MRRIFLIWERLGLTLWVGMSVMFLLILLGLRGSPLFSPEVKDTHPLVLFPIYYRTLFVILGSTCVASIAAAVLRRGVRSAYDHPQPDGALSPPGVDIRKAASIPIVPIVATAALVLVLLDYVFVFTPLWNMLPHPPYPDSFRSLHTASRYINSASLLLAAFGAVRSVTTSLNEK